LHPLPDDNDENLPIGKGLKGLTADGEELAVAAFHNVPNPEQRLKFWSEPDTELQLAAGANVSVFRMGIDWGRIVPDEPAEGTAQVVRLETGLLMGVTACSSILHVYPV
jgi:hypothetical protein